MKAKCFEITPWQLIQLMAMSPECKSRRHTECAGCTCTCHLFPQPNPEKETR